MCTKRAFSSKNRHFHSKNDKKIGYFLDQTRRFLSKLPIFVHKSAIFLPKMVILHQQLAITQTKSVIFYQNWPCSCVNRPFSIEMRSLSIENLPFSCINRSSRITKIGHFGWKIGQFRSKRTIYDPFSI